MSRRNKILIVLVMMTIALLVVMNQMQKAPLVVTVLPIETGVVESTVSNTRAGTVKACQRSRLSMSLGGRVEKLYVKEGDRVTAGQILLELWNFDHRAMVAQAEASLSQASHEQKRVCMTAEQNLREQQRSQALLQKKLTSQTLAEAANTLAGTSSQSCEAAQYQVRMSQANLDLARARFDLTTLRAPYAGVIAEVNSELGEYVTPSPSGVLTPPAIEMIDDGCLYVTAPIDEVDAMPVKTGMEARITLDAFRGETFVGHITRIAPYVVDLEKQARTVDVDVRFDHLPAEVRLLVGYSADIEVVLEEQTSVLRVPTESILENRFVYVLSEDDVLEKREFVPGLSNWTYTEVKSGLQAGERIVASPDKAGIKDGAHATTETP